MERFPTLRAWPSRLFSILLLVLLAPLAVRSQHPPILPDPKLTPGATLPVTKDDICVPGYTKKVRNVPKAVNEQVCVAYGIRRYQPGENESARIARTSDVAV